MFFVMLDRGGQVSLWSSLSLPLNERACWHYGAAGCARVRERYLGSHAR